MLVLSVTFVSSPGDAWLGLSIYAGVAAAFALPTAVAIAFAGVITALSLGAGLAAGAPWAEVG